MKLNLRLLHGHDLNLGKGLGFNRYRQTYLSSPDEARAFRTGGAKARQRAKKFARVNGRRMKGGR